jgi:acyl carrier protein
MTQEVTAPAGPQQRTRETVDLSAAFRAPGSDLERLLAELWSGKLAVEPIGVDDDFFELGGHSLMAAELLVDIQSVTGVEISATTLFLEPTIAELAKAITTGGGPACDSQS